MVTVALVVLAGCATYFPINDPISTWEKQGYRASRRWAPERSNRLLVVLAFSGGGTRAASLAYGVLRELEAIPVHVEGRSRTLLDEVDHVTGVSGGSFAAAYFGLRGHAFFDDFEERFLKQNVQRSLLLQLLWPINWVRLFSPYYARNDLAARHYDEILFEGATFRDLQDGDGPLVQINATDLVTGAPFSFIQEQFDFLCSDLGSYPISRAVAASSAVPGLLSPITLRNFGGTCGFEPPRWIAEAVERNDHFGLAYANARNLQSYYADARNRRYIRLIDGGVSDNLGVRGPFETNVLRAPLRGPRPPRLRELRHVLFVLVNAATSPESAWEEFDEDPGLANIIGQATTVQINRYTLETIERLRSALRISQEVGAEWSPPVTYRLVELDFSKVEDPEERRRLNELPTSFALPDDDVERLERTGRELLRASPELRAFLADLEATEGPPAD